MAKDDGQPANLVKNHLSTVEKWILLISLKKMG